MCFLLATREGYLSIASVVTSLYPAFTVVLAATVLREHVHRAQAAGLLLCAVAVTLVAAGLAASPGQHVDVRHLDVAEPVPDAHLVVLLLAADDRAVAG